MAKTFDELINQLTEDVRAAFSGTEDAEVTIEHIESNKASNESTFRIQGDAEQLFPQLRELETCNTEIETLKLTISPNPDYIDYRNASLREY